MCSFKFAKYEIYLFKVSPAFQLLTARNTHEPPSNPVLITGNDGWMDRWMDRGLVGGREGWTDGSTNLFSSVYIATIKAKKKVPLHSGFLVVRMGKCSSRSSKSPLLISSCSLHKSRRVKCYQGCFASTKPWHHHWFVTLIFYIDHYIAVHGCFLICCVVVICTPSPAILYRRKWERTHLLPKILVHS